MGPMSSEINLFLVTQVRNRSLGKCCSNRIARTFYRQSGLLTVGVQPRC